ncbi:retrovirus-related pol polyprotein from transposon TNT 1-94 [Tanacetum coccineum]
MGLWYSKDFDMSLIAYLDADHAGCQDTRPSTSGSAQFLGDKLVSWSSKKQKSTAISRLNILPYLGVMLKSYRYVHSLQIMVFNSIRFICTATTKVQLLYAATMFNTQEQSTSIKIQLLDRKAGYEKYVSRNAKTSDRGGR